MVSGGLSCCRHHVILPRTGYELSAADLLAGQDSYTSALAAINFCMINDEWEGYADQIVQIERPAWARRTDVEQVATL